MARNTLPCTIDTRDLREEVVNAIRAMHRAGLGIRRIERELRVARNSIRKVLRGKHGSDNPFVRHLCGHKVKLPCRICAAEAELRKRLKPLAA